MKVTDYLTDRQWEKVFTHPDMVLQFAHYLRDRWHQRGEPDVAVYAHVQASLNRRKTQPFIDAKVDLSKVEWQPLQASVWVLPMEE